jgi:predicted RNase H-like HicB family nuclease
MTTPGSLAETLKRNAPTAKVERDPEDGSWAVSLPNLPGHVGAGDTLEDAVTLALDAAEAWALAMPAPALPAELRALSEVKVTDTQIEDALRSLGHPITLAESIVFTAASAFIRARRALAGEGGTDGR